MSETIMYIHEITPSVWWFISLISLNILAVRCPRDQTKRLCSEIPTWDFFCRVVPFSRLVLAFDSTDAR